MKNLFLFLLLLCVSFSFSQNNPSIIAEGRFVGKTIPLKDFAPIEEQTYRTTQLNIIANNLRANEKLNPNGLPINGLDPVRQNKNGNQSSSVSVLQNFDGISVSESGGFTPPDPTGAAGPNHYVNSVNTAIKVFDKTGLLLAGPVDLGTFLSSGNNDGDPIIMYDQLADRFFVSQFGANFDSLIIGVSDSPDPTGAYNVYEFTFDAFPDYPKYTVWPDGYYITANKGGSDLVYVIEREVMINAGTNPNIIGFPLPGITNNPNTVFSPATANLLGNTFPDNIPGYVVYLQDDGWNPGIMNDHLKIWEIDIDWTTPANSIISTPIEVPVAPFDSVFAPSGTGDVEQPGTAQRIDMIGGIISYAANYRSFGTHNSWVITFNVDVDGNDTSGIRWIELRNDDILNWDVYQEGTYSPADGNSRFMGSAAIDVQGNIGLGFNIASATLPAGIAFTGRYSNDPLGQMTVTETTIVNGAGVQTFSNRFGDYSHTSMDPDGFTFWNTAQYFIGENNWQSRVAAFRLSPGFDDDLGVSAIVTPTNGILGTNETVEITIRNYGTNPQFNFPVELYLDGNLVATETFLAAISPNQTANHTFTQTVDLSTAGQDYTLQARTVLSNDQFTQNDAFSRDVSHLLGNDVGIVSIDSPESGTNLIFEDISVTVRNFGANPQANIPVQYTVNGGTPVDEVIPQVLNSEESITYTFTQSSNFTDINTYNITATTLLASDELASNDASTKVVENLICSPAMDCSFGDGLLLFSVADINNPSGCEGYGDFSNQIANLTQDTTYPLTVTTGFGSQYLSVWIDFDDNNIFSTDEKVVDNYIVGQDQGGGTFTETLDLVIPPNAAIGSHRMRAKTNWDAPVPDDACVQTVYGETEDYTASIQLLGTNSFNMNNSDFIVVDKGDNQFEAILNTNYSGNAYVSVYNLLGQQLKFKRISKSSPSSYNVMLNLSEASSGVYLVRIGVEGSTTYQVKKIVVR
jgi:hypothetical protein